MEKTLEQRIEELEKRVAELEKRIPEQPVTFAIRKSQIEILGDSEHGLKAKKEYEKLCAK